MQTRTAVVIPGATPDAVRAIGGDQGLTLSTNRLGTLVVGRAGDRVIDYADRLGGPIYDIMYNAGTGWFVVTVYRGLQATRWDNRPDTDAGYPRIADVLGATSPPAILEALDVAPSAIGYAPS